MFLIKVPDNFENDNNILTVLHNYFRNEKYTV